MPAHVTHFLPLTLVRRARLLPVPGRVLVRSGQQVAATDVIAETTLPEKHLLLDIRRALGISSSGKAESLVTRKLGETVQAGDILAETGGLFSRVVRVPVAGTIVAINNGQVLLEPQGEPFRLLAGLSGVITETLADRGAVVETNGVLVQGVWGNNRIDASVFLSLARTPDEELTRDRLDVSMRGAVVLAGTLHQADVLQAAADLPLRGLVLASLNPELIPLARAARFPILVIEGFGRIPLNTTVYNLLTTNEKRDISVNAVEPDPFNGDRPELVIHLPAIGEMPSEVSEFRAGQAVRVFGSPYSGLTGIITRIRPGVVQVPSGLRAMAAEVRLENNENALIPLVNLDVLE